LAYSIGVAVETYIFELNKSKPSLKQRAVLVLLMASVYFLVMLATNFFWLSHYGEQESAHRIILKVTFISLFWGVAMAFWPPKTPNCKLLVDDQSITSVTEYPGWMKWYKISRTVSAGKVRTIREFNGRLGAPGGLIVSERLGWSMWILGGIYIPITLPEYGRLKALVRSWRVPGSPD
jgi:hypothetical protein